MSTEPVAVITGAAQGIGAAVARRLHAEKYRLILLDRDADKLADLISELDGDASTQIATVVDVLNATQLQTAVTNGVAEFGGIDAVITCAGVNAYYDAISLTEDQWDQLFGVDLKAIWLTCRATIPHLLRSHRASIVTVSSIHAKMTDAGMFPYAAAKSGVEGLTRSLALDYGPSGIRVNAVAPGWTHTRLVDNWLDQHDDAKSALASVTDAHPLRRIAQPHEVANVVAFLLSEQASAVTGASFPVDCGLSARTAIQ